MFSWAYYGSYMKWRGTFKHVEKKILIYFSTMWLVSSLCTLQYFLQGLQSIYIGISETNETCKNEGLMSNEFFSRYSLFGLK